MRTILVVANETLGGRPLLDAVRERARRRRAASSCACRAKPRHGNIIYDDAVFQTAQMDRPARAVMRAEGIDVIGEVGDPDPFTATMDAVGMYDPDEVVISTFPATSSAGCARPGRARDEDGRASRTTSSPTSTRRACPSV